MKRIKVMSVFGTRPEAVKMAPLVKALEANPYMESSVCVTAQHREMLDQVLDIFGIRPDYDLNIMQDRQTLADITTRALEGLYDVFGKAAPDIVLVHGDTTTTFAAALAAYYLKIRVGHVEAGLRTHDKYFPYPEEMNRRLTGAIADLHFAPTVSNRENLIREGISPEKIYVTGNTVIDALSTTVSDGFVFGDPFLKGFSFDNKRVIAMTAHRRENIGRPFEEIFAAVRKIADDFTDVHIIYPVHLNPLVGEPARRILGDHPRIHLIKPVNVQEMHNLMARSYLVLTDSGGLQEEAPALGKPVLVLRNETERPEAVAAGTVRLAGTGYESVYRSVRELLDREELYTKMARAVNPYGDGRASRRIVEALLHGFGITGERPADFVA
ncbi:MAG TPA: UDP-N-acetylglucosamine 2-epimerase (non-hydrolyzing) [Thermoclostridium caenicola]|uniref:UDP-N-acetylglucosamine 2-epimerase (non-hydrolyzing) n=1 Tax=Thermoclostridium caenicola TaxID=659425 RepID=A0A1M6E7F0_9FIRM|nr:UDP-N-acetylglucosamine 2-epimerase (non-hydrolyzing) [Thermoclostridium caenicola]SHI81417.1 UDP-N-Acetylglucosamine 2-epimerase [Thermoclostridium caenicola]HOK42943.1 UDP-N-acetylglucosamine 2-epimerase (non-hydrolyzing) [Thermoclostridium caenicola]HOL84837.1 UDP-N-acetylglucosamine 2-epimerase (non-hydrolyzing) [Thermoclostridium caenicola]HOP73017.1 UDP-N-acetylglucosamine 2-epimerase (non-hydrolyzing) [Thermoclostridium caenicola]HPO76479.1 UDP-N-acetylglucosamine 2-epimerase (non-hy